jgi:hypothetical protein
MNEVAMITPEPKYLATKNAHPGTFNPLWRFANTGKTAPVPVSDLPLP